MDNGCTWPDAGAGDQHRVHRHTPFGSHIAHREEQQIHVFLRRQTDRSDPARQPSRQTAADLRRPAPDARPDGSRLHDIRTPDRPDSRGTQRLRPDRARSPVRSTTPTNCRWPASPSRWRATIPAAPFPRNNGSFTIDVPDADAVLSFTYLGYISKKVSVPVSQNSLEVFLAEDAVRMEDVVVVGYGTQKKVNLTGAITTVDDTQLANRSAPSVAHMLQGAVPGLTISTSSGRPGNSADLNIRGITSINGGSPLVLIDGAEGDLMKLNPNDVASISVIKDASAAAIYGARAAYGVVLVTTKEGDDSDKTRVSYSGRWGWNSPTTSTDYETRGYYSVYRQRPVLACRCRYQLHQLYRAGHDGIMGPPQRQGRKSRTSVGEDRPARRPRHICLLRQLRLVPLPVQGRASQHEPQRLAVGRQLEGEVHAFGQLLQRRGTLPSGTPTACSGSTSVRKFRSTSTSG